MTREEIKYASKDYVNYLLDKQEYHNENYTEDDIRQAFEKGVVYANNNLDLSSLWHPASEMPERFKCEILYETGSENGFEVTYMPEELNADNWWNVLKVCGIVRWAYISDLLPKQFGNSKQVKGGEK